MASLTRPAVDRFPPDADRIGAEARREHGLPADRDLFAWLCLGSLLASIAAAVRGRTTKATLPGAPWIAHSQSFVDQLERVGPAEEKAEGDDAVFVRDSTGRPVLSMAAGSLGELLSKRIAPRNRGWQG